MENSLQPKYTSIYIYIYKICYKLLSRQLIHSQSWDKCRDLKCESQGTLHYGKMYEPFV